MRAYLLLLGLGFCLVASAQQRGLLTAGVNAFPSENIIFGGKLAYYQQFKSGQFYGVKVAMETDALRAGKQEHRFVCSNADIVRRWAVGKYTKSRLWFDAGLSVFQSTEIDPPNSRFSECGTGLTEDDLLRIAAYNAKWHFDKSFYTGIALGTNIEFRLAGVYFGLDLGANVYYAFRVKEVYLGLNPTLNCSIPVGKTGMEVRHKR